MAISNFELQRAFLQGSGEVIRGALNEFVGDTGELSQTLGQLVTLANELKADHNALLAKLDADAGVTDTNYAATLATAAPNAVL